MMMGDEDFGKYFNMDNPLAKEQADLKLDGLTAKEKTEKLRDLLMAYYTWDQSYGLYSISPKKLQKEGTANSCTLNFALMSMLRDAGITACPVVLSRRSKGRLPYAHPSVSALNTMVLAVADAADSTVFYVDAAAKGYPVGTLTANELVDRGRMLNKSGNASWVDLRNCCDGKVITSAKATITPDGMLQGSYNAVYRGVAAGHYRDIYRDVTDSVAYVEHFATSNNVEIDSFELTGIDSNSDEVKEDLTFSRSLNTDDEHIYLNPFLFIDATNPFKAETRDLPVEFMYNTMNRHTIQLTLPDGYVVEELPSSFTLVMPNEDMNARLRVRQSGNTLVINYNFSRKTLLYDTDNYSYLRDFWATAEQKLGEMIVLKKQL